MSFDSSTPRQANLVSNRILIWATIYANTSGSGTFALQTQKQILMQQLRLPAQFMTLAKVKGKHINMTPLLICPQQIQVLQREIRTITHLALVSL